MDYYQEFRKDQSCQKLLPKEAYVSFASSMPKNSGTALRLS